MTAVLAAAVTGLFLVVPAMVRYFAPEARLLHRLERETKVLTDLPEGAAKAELLTVVTRVPTRTARSCRQGRPRTRSASSGPSPWSGWVSPLRC